MLRFISPYLPKDDRIVFWIGDFFHFCLEPCGHFDTAIIDLWVINEHSTKQAREHVAASMSVARALAGEFCEKVLVWGVRGY